MEKKKRFYNVFPNAWKRNVEQTQFEKDNDLRPDEIFDFVQI